MKFFISLSLETTIPSTQVITLPTEIEILSSSSSFAALFPNIIDNNLEKLIPIR